MKKARSSVSPSAAILAGGLLFTGPAVAANVFSENFEAVNPFGMPTYAYSLNYTQPNPLGGLLHAFGGSGTTNTFTDQDGPRSLLTGGISASQIDAGLVGYDFHAQFSGYLDQTDHGELSITFLDGLNAPIGSPVLLGGLAFVAALPMSPNARYPNARDWGTDTETGIVPAGARTISLVITEVKDPGGAVIDGYMDNIVLDANVVPEPGTLTLSGLAGLALLRRRRAR